MERERERERERYAVAERVKGDNDKRSLASEGKCQGWSQLRYEVIFIATAPDVQ